MYRIEITRNDLPQSIFGFQEVRDGISDFMQQLGDEVATDLQDEAELRCPSRGSLFYPAQPESTGNLQASHETDTTASETGFRVTLTNTADYASYVHDGHQTVPARPWMMEAAIAISNNEDEYVQEFIDWVAGIFEGEL